MAERNNFLLGNGEKLTTPVEVPAGGGAKKAPYSYEAAVRHLRPRVERIATAVAELPDAACPDDVAVAVLIDDGHLFQLSMLRQHRFNFLRINHRVHCYLLSAFMLVSVDPIGVSLSGI